jgi:hypothetical protein
MMETYPFGPQEREALRHAQGERTLENIPSPLGLSIPSPFGLSLSKPTPSFLRGLPQ